MFLELTRKLFDYSRWANAKLLEQAARISNEQFCDGGIYPHGGIRQTLTHILFAEWI